MSGVNVVREFGERFFATFVGQSAESAFKTKAAEFCMGFTPAHFQKAAESGIPFEELIRRSGFELKPTRESDLNPWQRHLVYLSEARLLELLKEAVSPAHAQMLDRYPQVAQALIGMIKNYVVPG